MWILLTILVHVAGFTTAIATVMTGQHRSRGAVAWVIALIGLPWLALPVYWASGQVRYGDYRNSRADSRALLNEYLNSLHDEHDRLAAPQSDPRRSGERAAIAAFGIARTSADNATSLFEESTDAWLAIAESLKSAQRYILLQSYLLRDDRLGSTLAEMLTSAINRGCNVFVLFDEIGSDELSDDFVAGLREAGARIIGFSENRRYLPRIRFNFRNHRKVLVVDGVTGFIGGMNLGEEYLDGADEFHDWRDTHMRIEGPAVQDLQLSFFIDWRFANKGDGGLAIDRLNWPGTHRPQSSGSTHLVTICDVGPHRNVYSGDVLFTTLIESATHRLWIATPYFVPDDRVISSLKSAALRGVDLRIIVPATSDHQIFLTVHEEFARELEPFGIRMFTYGPGFMHQKVLLVDDQYASIGSANFDNRSFRLNFEILAVVYEPQFCARVHAMLLDDLENCEQLIPDPLSSLPWHRRLLAGSTRLLSPVL